jgi:hypothetical protein
MKLRWKVTIGLVTVGILATVILSRRASSEQRALEQTRRDLRAQGFKIDLAEFDFSVSDEFRARVTALTNASTHLVPSNHGDAARRLVLQQVMPELMQTIGRDSAIPIWLLNSWAADPGAATYLQLAGLPTDVWPALREGFRENNEILDRACVAALAGPIRIPLNASHGYHMLLPHAAALKNLTQTLGGRVALDLHDGHPSAAWTNLLAATRLVTAWETEPVEVSQLVRASCATMVFNITWQALQTNGWSDEHLSQLQREWESVDFFAALPETAAFGRACASMSCQLEREESKNGFDPMLRDFFRSPRQAWANFSYRYQQLRYRRHGSYEDEKGLLLHYRDHEQQLKQAVQAQTWSEMRQLPGVTNNTSFRSKHTFSHTMMLLNQRQMMFSVQGQGQGLLGRAAEAEVRRRLIVTAIALERFRNQHGAYPKSLEQLSPDLLKNPPVDFMDGKPLRYRLTDGGHFVLYSVGLNCADDGGQMRQPHRRGNVYEEGFAGPQATDLVWPRPAAPEEVQAKLKNKRDLRRNGKLPKRNKQRRSGKPRFKSFLRRSEFRKPRSQHTRVSRLAKFCATEKRLTKLSPHWMSCSRSSKLPPARSQTSPPLKYRSVTMSSQTSAGFVCCWMLTQKRLTGLVANSKSAYVPPMVTAY